jgi:hypothetical protein
MNNAGTALRAVQRAYTYSACNTYKSYDAMRIMLAMRTMQMMFEPIAHRDSRALLLPACSALCACGGWQHAAAQPPRERRCCAAASIRIER